MKEFSSLGPRNDTLRISGRETTHIRHQHLPNRKPGTARILRCRRACPDGGRRKGDSGLWRGGEWSVERRKSRSPESNWPMANSRGRPFQLFWREWVRLTANG